MNKLYENLIEKQANLWAWDGCNPYSRHPLCVLDLEDKATVTPAMIKRSVQQREARAKQNIDSVESATDPALLQKSQKLLLDPLTRVFCELCRIPPVEIQKSELDKIKSDAAGTFKVLDQLSEPSGIDYNWSIIAQQVAATLMKDAVQTHDFGKPVLKKEQPLDLKQQPLIPFRRRESWKPKVVL